MLELPYPGGPQIEKLAKEGQDTIPMPRPYKGEKHLNFSYSGIKTAVINYAHNAQQKGIEINKADLACSFQERAVGMLVENTLVALKQHKATRVALAGGVGANGRLREKLSEMGAKNNVEVLLPPKSLGTDNAAMIAIGAYYALKDGADASDLTLDVNPDL